jgi:hypothetical protein
MVVEGGGGIRGGVGGGGGDEVLVLEEEAVKDHRLCTPRIFSKVAARYDPLVLPPVLHDLPENYMKNLRKFTREGDLTSTKHINIFDQFDDILGLEHKDVYSILLVQNFEGRVRL